MISVESTAQNEGNRKKGPATKLEPRTYTLSWIGHKLLIPVANPLSPIAFYAGHLILLQICNSLAVATI